MQRELTHQAPTNGDHKSSSSNADPVLTNHGYDYEDEDD